MNELNKKLAAIQKELKAPKSQFNKFANFSYRSCEDILEAVKPLLKKYDCILTISDEVKEVGTLQFIEAKATLTDKEQSVTVTSQAGIDINRKGMDVAQSFGSSSSYARKYALNGLFLIDDNKDSDFTNKHGKEPEKTPPKKRDKQSVCATEQTISKNDIEALLLDCSTIEEVTNVWWLLTKAQQEDKDIKHWFSSRKGQL